MSSNIKIFKLTYSGSFNEITLENLLQNFTLFDIITFYDPSIKRLYIWIGKKASQSLKSHIPKVRELLHEQYPELKILRNITIESGSESSEFFKIIGKSKIELDKRIRDLEIKLLPSIAEINKLKEAADKNFLLENYKEAIDIGNKILKLAQEIDDESLEIDQKSFIREAQIRIKAVNVIKEIENDCKDTLIEFQKLINNNNIKEAHNIVTKLKEKYENDIKLYSIPLFHDLILKDENILFNLRTEQTKIHNKLDDLEFRYNKCLNDNYLEKAGKIIKDAKSLVNQLIEDDISKRWIFLDSKLKEAKEAFIERIEKLSKNALTYLDNGEILKTLEIFEKIIIELDKSTKGD